MIASGRSGAIYDGPRSGRPDRNAPFAAIRRISSIAARFGLSVLPPATGPRSATCHQVFCVSYRRVEARASSRSTATPIPPYPVDLRAGNVRNGQGVGRFERDAMLDVDTVHWHCPSLAGFSPLGCPGMTELKFLRHVRSAPATRARVWRACRYWRRHRRPHSSPRRGKPSCQPRRRP